MASCNQLDSSILTTFLNLLMEFKAINSWLVIVHGLAIWVWSTFSYFCVGSELISKRQRQNEQLGTIQAQKAHLLPFWVFDLFSYKIERIPTRVREQCRIECEGNVPNIKRGSFKRVLKVRWISCMWRRHNEIQENKTEQVILSSVTHKHKNPEALNPTKLLINPFFCFCSVLQPWQ